jgi:hypothetical protein
MSKPGFEAKELQHFVAVDAIAIAALGRQP